MQETEGAIEQEADSILTIANPDPRAWGLTEVPDLQAQLFDDLEMHVPLPAQVPRYARDDSLSSDPLAL
ncbi:MAG: hypothetical protein ACXW5U_03085 [Thermoanaerobaculia bacterium]